MRHIVFLTAVLVVAGTALGQDWEGDLVQGDLHGMIGIAFDSKYIWRGFDIYDDNSAVHIMGDLNFFDTGFGLSAVGHRANSSGYENLERWDYTLYYQNGLFSGEPYATNFRLGWVYYNYPDMPSKWRDLQEVQAILSWPNLLPVKGLCPSYVVAKVWPSESGSGVGGNASGWLHIFMLDYGFTVPGVIPEIPEHVIRLHSELVYNDGFGWNGQNVDHSWSNAVFGVSTDVDLGHNLTLTPGIYYQLSMESTINDENELWANVGLRYSF
jgi:hypothetical protein